LKPLQGVPQKIIGIIGLTGSYFASYFWEGTRSIRQDTFAV
jgi:hypothetical protein